MAEAVICEPLRTPVGRFGGVLCDVPAHTLAAGLIRELARRNGLSGDDIDDVILGQASPSGEAPAIGRVAALDAGLGDDVPGQQVDRRCGAGLQAILTAVLQVATGAGDLVLAGGAESMSQAEFYATGMRWGVKGGVVPSTTGSRGPGSPRAGRFPVPGGMIETAENLRRRVLDQPRGPGRARGAVAPASRWRRSGRSVRAGDRPGRGAAAPG